MNPFGLLVVAAGVFTIAGGLSEWPWFWKSSRAEFATTLLTRKGARIFYVAIGIAITVFGLWATVSAVPPEPSAAAPSRTSAAAPSRTQP